MTQQSIPKYRLERQPTRRELEEYEAQKRAFLEAHPGATHDEFGAFLFKLSRRLGL